MKWNKGFSLVEVMLAAGLASGVALVVAKVAQESNKTTKTMETNIEVTTFLGDIAYILSDKQNCNATVGIGSNIGTPINSIKRFINGVENNIYETSTPANPKKYGQSAFIIESITTELNPGGVNLVVEIERVNKAINGARKVKKKIPLKAVVTGGKIDSCFSDIESMIESAVQQSCRGNSARFDPATKECYHDVKTDQCPTGQVLRSIQQLNGQIISGCSDVIDAPLSCPIGSYFNGISSKGVANCAPLEVSNMCGEGQYAYNIQNGTMVCKSIPRCGQRSILRSNPDSGELRCVQVQCNPTNQYLAGFDAAGEAVCKNFPDKACGQGQYIKEIKPDGTTVCGQVPNHLSLPVVNYSFVDGYDAGSNTWSRKSLTDIAREMCTMTPNRYWDSYNNQCKSYGGGMSCPAGYAMYGAYADGTPMCRKIALKTKTRYHEEWCEHKIEHKWVDVIPGSSCFLTQGPRPWIQPSFWSYSGTTWTYLETYYSGFSISCYHDPKGGETVGVTCIAPDFDY